MENEKKEILSREEVEKYPMFTELDEAHKVLRQHPDAKLSDTSIKKRHGVIEKILVKTEKSNVGECPFDYGPDFDTINASGNKYWRDNTKDKCNLVDVALALYMTAIDIVFFHSYMRGKDTPCIALGNFRVMLAVKDYSELIKPNEYCDGKILATKIGLLDKPEEPKGPGNFAVREISSINKYVDAVLMQLLSKVGIVYNKIQNPMCINNTNENAVDVLGYNMYFTTLLENVIDVVQDELKTDPKFSINFGDCIFSRGSDDKLTVIHVSRRKSPQAAYITECKKKHIENGRVHKILKLLDDLDQQTE